MLLCSLISCHSNEDVMEYKGLKRTTSQKSMSPFGQGKGKSCEVFDREGQAVKSLLRQESVSANLLVSGRL